MADQLFRADGQTEVVKQTVTFQNSADAPTKKGYVAGIWHIHGVSNLEIKLS
jgi:hypothetical protein